jgi:hypothetical protein
MLLSGEFDDAVGALVGRSLPADSTAIGDMRARIGAR